MAGVPWFFDSDTQAYKVRPGFRFPALHLSSGNDSAAGPDPIILLANAKKIIAEADRFLETLRQLIAWLEGLPEPPSP
jgi:hypothetical protein